jgi:hypothetical protein
LECENEQVTRRREFGQWVHSFLCVMRRRPARLVAREREPETLSRVRRRQQQQQQLPLKLPGLGEQETPAPTCRTTGAVCLA